MMTDDSKVQQAESFGFIFQKGRALPETGRLTVATTICRSSILYSFGSNQILTRLPARLTPKASQASSAITPITSLKSSENQKNLKAYVLTLKRPKS